ncbi:hypothetical protein PHLCEN_2v2676 [Hermanssonia centrifuga]|uniref:Uncharacterized protein n=1 Tax=Hermanssonia centrifuga TaxID=98765 RepID=A0A2R6RIJ6_9APHY|nr:hypothetical protein PHLCEN_2v2676 [Hermanssonia centrifuga]
MGSLSQTVVPLNPPHIPGSIFSPGLTPPIVSFPGSVLSTPTDLSSSPTLSTTSPSPTLPDTTSTPTDTTSTSSPMTSLPIAPGSSQSVSQTPSSSSVQNSFSHTSSAVSISLFSITSVSSTASFSSTGSSSSASPSTSSPALSVSAVSSSHRHAGAIAGGVIGGVAVLVAIIAALIFFRCRNVAPRVRRRNGDVLAPTGGAFRKWDGLASRDSAIGAALPISNATYKVAPTRHASTGSAAAMISPPSSSLGHGRYTTTPGLSHENEDLSDDEEKWPTTPSSTLQGHRPFELIETVPPLPVDLSSAPATPMSAAFPHGRSRERSASQNRALTLAKLDATALPRSPYSPYTPTSPSATSHKRQSLDGRVLSSPSGSSSSHYPMPPSTEMIRMARTSSGTKRTARKAVPKYDEAEFAAVAPSMSPSPFADQERRQSSYYETATTHSAETSSSNLHASIRAERSREDLEAAGYEIPALTAKASFGDMRNVHYLIPDLPPPQKN